MSKNQYTVLGLLLATAGLHIWLDKRAQDSFLTFLKITPQNWAQIGSDTISAYLMWFIALAAMLLLADYAPKAAIWISVLLLTGAVLINNSALINWLNTTSAFIAGDRPHPGGEGLTGSSSQK